MNHGAKIAGNGFRPWSMMVRVGLLVLSVGLELACVPSKVQTQISPQFDPSSIRSIAVVPFQILETPQWKGQGSVGGFSDPEEIRTQFRLPGTDQGERREHEKDLYSVPESGARRLTEMVRSTLASRASLRVIGPPETASVLKRESVEAGREFKNMAREAGTQFGVDGALLGLVRTYRERDGSKLGARPAAVGFELYLISTADGTVLWTGDYFEEQKPLTEDVVGFFEKGGGFVTVEELAAFGVQKVLETFPVGKNG